MAELKNSPVFFVGVPRSGTTIIFNSFSKAREFGWISQYQNKFPQVQLPSAINLLTDNALFYKQGKRGRIFGKRTTLIPTPSEAYVFYNKYAHKDFSTHFLNGEEVTPDIASDIRSRINGVLQLQGKKRYVQKFTGPGKIDLLTSIFPDAKFVHVVRHPVEVMKSLLNVNFWNERGGKEKLWWKGGFSEEELKKYAPGKATPEALALFQWSRIVEDIENSLAILPKNRYTKIHYADFLENPEDEMSRIFSDLGLTSDQRVWDELRESKIQRKSKVGDDLSKYVDKAATAKYLKIYEDSKLRRL